MSLQKLQLCPYKHTSWWGKVPAACISALENLPLTPRERVMPFFRPWASLGGHDMNKAACETEVLRLCICMQGWNAMCPCFSLFQLVLFSSPPPPPFGTSSSLLPFAIICPVVRHCRTAKDKKHRNWRSRPLWSRSCLSTQSGSCSLGSSQHSTRSSIRIQCLIVSCSAYF